MLNAVLRCIMKCARVERLPFIWFWPDGHRNCVIMTHDVETAAGRDFCPELARLDATYGFRSSFQIVPEQIVKDIHKDKFKELKKLVFE